MLSTYTNTHKHKPRDAVSSCLKAVRCKKDRGEKDGGRKISFKVGHGSIKSDTTDDTSDVEEIYLATMLSMGNIKIAPVNNGLASSVNKLARNQTLYILI